MSARAGASRVVVVGGGLSGALLALLLGRRGHAVEVLERRPDPRTAGAERGRSINLAISARGLAALEAVGLAERIRAIALPMTGRMIHAPDGQTTFQAYGRRGQAINSISRADLNLALLEAADELPGVTLRFGRRCVGIEPASATVATVAGEDPAETRHAGDLVVGADGAFSVVRQQLQRRERFDHALAWLAHGYKELVIPPSPSGQFQLDPTALHIWPRGGYMMMAMPNLDRSFTVTLYLAWEGGAASFAALEDRAAVRRFFVAQFPDAVPLMPTLEDDFAANPTGALVTVRCWPWTEGRAVLIGDAAHAIVPFFGQGANAAFEDVVALADALEREPDPVAASRRYAAERKPHAEAIADLALANFIEMRDHVASAGFLVRKRLERLLHAVFPRAFLPLYSMISFTTIPYAVARERARRQGRILRTAGAVAALVLLGGAAALLLRLLAR